MLDQKLVRSLTNTYGKVIVVVPDKSKMIELSEILPQGVEYFVLEGKTQAELYRIETEESVIVDQNGSILKFRQGESHAHK